MDRVQPVVINGETIKETQMKNIWILEHKSIRHLGWK